MILNYIVPKIGSGTLEDPYRPKYSRLYPSTDHLYDTFTAKDFGGKSLMMIRVDLTGSQQAELESKPDVIPVKASSLALIVSALAKIECQANLRPGSLLQDLEEAADRECEALGRDVALRGAAAVAERIAKGRN